MTAAAPAVEAEPAKRGLKLPSAYTILFILIVAVAIATWIIPAGRYDYNDDGTPIPGSYHSVEANPQQPETRTRMPTPIDSPAVTFR